MILLKCIIHRHMVLPKNQNKSIKRLLTEKKNMHSIQIKNIYRNVEWHSFIKILHIRIHNSVAGHTTKHIL